jgi:hypothetical protein
MDTLYLVVKHRFQIVLDCLTDDLNSPQANGEFNRLSKLCQGRHERRSSSVPADKNAAFLNSILLRKAASQNAFNL